MNGSSRAPNRDLVRRTPLPTARTRPLRLVRIVTIRSASPSFWVRSTMPSSRYRLTLPLSRTAGRARAQARAGYPSARGQMRARAQPRRDRFTAESTARRDAVTVFASTPTPHQGRPSISHSTYAAACASLPADSACSA